LVIPAKAGIHSIGDASPVACGVDSRLRGNDCTLERPRLANKTVPARLEFQDFVVDRQCRFGGAAPGEFACPGESFFYQDIAQRRILRRLRNLLRNIRGVVRVTYKAASPPTSGIDDTLEVTTGTPFAIASNTGMPKPSSKDGNRNTLAA